MNDFLIVMRGIRRVI